MLRCNKLRLAVPLLQRAALHGVHNHAIMGRMNHCFCDCSIFNMDSNSTDQQQRCSAQIQAMTSTISASRTRHRSAILTKRVRRPNFTPYELEALVNAMENRPDLVSNRLGGAYQKHSDLSKAWEDVCSEVNTFSLVEREIRECKDKWTDLKYRTKMKALRSRTIMEESNSSSPSQHTVLSPVEERIMDLIIDRSTSAEETIADSAAKELPDAMSPRDGLTPQDESMRSPLEDARESPSLQERITPSPSVTPNPSPVLVESDSVAQSFLRHQDTARPQEQFYPVPSAEECDSQQELVAVAVDIREELRSLVDLERQKVDLKRRKLDLEFARLHLQAKQFGFRLVKTERGAI